MKNSLKDNTLLFIELLKNKCGLAIRKCFNTKLNIFFFF